MENPADIRHLYAELADGYAERSQPQFRDRFLVLAAAAALSSDDGIAAERYRQRLLSVNPHHLLKPYTSFAQAMQAPDVQTYVNDLRHNYPADVARSLLRSMRDLKEQETQIPVTAPLIRLDGPDLLMDDENEPLNILSFRDESPTGLPPTLPPNLFPASPAAPAHRTIPPALYEAVPPPNLPPTPAPKPPKPVRSVPPPAPGRRQCRASNARRCRFRSRPLSYARRQNSRLPARGYRASFSE